MKTRATILVCWATFITLCCLCRAFRDVLPAVLPGLALVVSRFVIPWTSERYKRVALGSFVVANVLGVAAIAPASLFSSVALLGAAAFGAVCFVAMVRSDILVFQRHAAVA